MIGNDWRLEFPEEESDELMHYGKKGMKWGKRNAAGSTAAPSLTRAVALGTYGGLQKESRFTNPKALAKRKQAGKVMTASVLTAIGGAALSTIGSASGNASVKAGTALVGRLLTTAGGLGAVAANAGNISAIIDEKAARKSS